MGVTKRKRNGRQFTRDELAQFDRMLDAGATQASIAKALHCHPKTLTKYFGDLLKGQHPRGRRGRTWTEEERQLVAVVAGLGIGHAEIAAMVGLSTGEFQAAFSEDLRGAKTRVDAEEWPRAAHYLVAAFILASIVRYAPEVLAPELELQTGWFLRRFLIAADRYFPQLMLSWLMGGDIYFTNE
jgi:hypothetical protein